MKIPCELKKWRTQKKSVKIILLIELDDIPDSLYKFEDMPLNIVFNEKVEINGEIKNIEQLASGSINIILYAKREYKKEMIKCGPELKKLNKFQTEFLIDADEQLKRFNTINGDQRAKIYAIIRDIDEYTGQGVESLKMQLKLEFVRDTEHDMFSLSDCSKNLARDFIEYLIRFCFENGVELSDHPRNAFDSIENYIRVCLDKKNCCICGKPYSGSPHHVDTIGMGNNRNKVDDSNKLKLPLCYEEHHPEIHTIGDMEFMAKYHVVGVS